MGITIQPPGPATQVGAGAASKQNHGVATGPAANATIATIAVGQLVAGTRYTIDVYAYLNGTTASPADDDNLKVVFNGATLGIVTIDGTAGSIGRVVKFTLTSPPSDGINAISVQAIALATGTAIYHVTIIATPIGD